MSEFGAVEFDFLELIGADEDDFEEFEEKMDDAEAAIDDYSHAIEAELQRVNDTELMEKLGQEVHLEYNIKLRPRS